MRQYCGPVLKWLAPASLCVGMVVVAPASATADFLDFTVDEGGVPGALNFEHTVDKINGAYTEVITFGAGGAFDVSAYANFGQYFANEGSLLVPTQLNNLGATGYGLYALFTASGVFDGTKLVGDSAEVSFYLDPGQDTDFTTSLGAAGATPTPSGTGDDLLIMTANNLISGVGIPGDPGAFDFKFLQPLLALPAGQAYWPNLDTLSLTMTVDGDIDEFGLQGTQIVTGDLSVAFTPDQVVPEPATLTLFGAGLLATVAIRRRGRRAAR